MRNMHTREAMIETAEETFALALLHDNTILGWFIYTFACALCADMRSE